jgi:hypothetical protein
MCGEVGEERGFREEVSKEPTSWGTRKRIATTVPTKREYNIMKVDKLIPPPSPPPQKKIKKW